MDENNKRKRRRGNRLQSLVNLLCVVSRMWADVHSGAKTLEQISIKGYNQDNVLGNIPIRLLTKYILQENCPSFEQMPQLRKERNAYINGGEGRKREILSEFSSRELKEELKRRAGSNNTQQTLF